MSTVNVSSHYNVHTTESCPKCGSKLPRAVCSRVSHLFGASGSPLDTLAAPDWYCRNPRDRGKPPRRRPSQPHHRLVHDQTTRRARAISAAYNSISFSESMINDLNSHTSH